MINYLEILKNYLYYKHFKQYFTTVLEFELSLLFNDISFKNRLDFKFFFQQDNTHILKISTAIILIRTCISISWLNIQFKSILFFLLFKR